MAGPGLIPELDVSDLGQSLEFYVSLIGFEVLYEREEERFAYLTLDDAHLMLEEAAVLAGAFALRRSSVRTGGA